MLDIIFSENILYDGGFHGWMDDELEELSQSQSQSQQNDPDYDPASDLGRASPDMDSQVTEWLIDTLIWRMLDVILNLNLA